MPSQLPAIPAIPEIVELPNHPPNEETPAFAKIIINIYLLNRFSGVVACLGMVISAILTIFYEPARLFTGIFAVIAFFCLYIGLVLLVNGYEKLLVARPNEQLMLDYRARVKKTLAAATDNARATWLSVDSWQSVGNNVTIHFRNGTTRYYHSLPHASISMVHGCRRAIRFTQVHYTLRPSGQYTAQWNGPVILSDPSFTRQSLDCPPSGLQLGGNDRSSGFPALPPPPPDTPPSPRILSLPPPSSIPKPDPSLLALAEKVREAEAAVAARAALEGEMAELKRRLAVAEAKLELYQADWPTE